MIRAMKKEDLQQCGEIYALAFKFYEKNGFKLSQGTVCMYCE